ncbi:MULTISPECIES: DUF7683 domain-containing protein [Pseudomonas]|uniref:DUF7683 domain-containing protein n=1 Tax=Pseudomonas moraviensis TaxID=321662 RepID=A0A2A2PI42_9PSED|nr:MULTISPECIES: hypothetical protein [Pseudomonas]MBA5982382.1 hypothetical protein [Pseudomonas sp. MD195_PC81_125]MBA5983452.1 hypothetical protein [Pseudomonas sp. MD195_PC81_125]PAW50599.1 hypothetical protein CKQ68_25105 [Pseudomonas moraviensis]PAW55107.1 hypothetical protein CKQ80_07265 [Pseudomonas moraviensis]QXE08738.1 hypothetical protein GTQ41_06595 [Pseudomonas sp. AN-B15]
MKHIVEVFDQKTEVLLLSVDIAEHHEDALKVLMNWKQPEDEFDGYDLSEEQINILEDWTGKQLSGVNRIVQLVCIE